MKKEKLVYIRICARFLCEENRTGEGGGRGRWIMVNVDDDGSLLFFKRVLQKNALLSASEAQVAIVFNFFTHKQ